MEKQGKESVLLSANDQSIVLSTHRVLQKTQKGTKDILLKDLVSFQTVSKLHRYTKFFALLSGMLAAVVALLYLLKTVPFKTMTEQEALPVLGIFGGLVLISVILLLTVKEKFLEIKGRFGSLSFSIKDLSAESLNKFTRLMKEESDRRKREE